MLIPHEFNGLRRDLEGHGWMNQRQMHIRHNLLDGDMLQAGQAIFNNMPMNGHADLFDRYLLRQPPNNQILKLDVTEDNVVSYSHERSTSIGTHRFTDKELSRDGLNYFEVEISSLVKAGQIIVGIIPTEAGDGPVGVVDKSVGLNITNGILVHKGSQRRFGPTLSNGDVLGIKLDFYPASQPFKDAVEVIFFVNGEIIDSRGVFVSAQSFIPAACMSFPGESLKFRLEGVIPPQIFPPENMECDHFEDAWERLFDVRLNGDIIEYSGAGLSHTDVGLAQAAKALSPSTHYFELEILDPGDSSYIAIGVAHKNYPKKQHPGWSKGSIAYHADDGEIFVEHGEGEGGGPVCKKGDRMGCGILFPSNYEEARIAAFEQPPVEQSPSPVKKPASGRKLARNRRGDNQRYLRQRQLVRELWAMPRLEIEDYFPYEQLDCGVKVKVFFTKNGQLVATKDMPLPLEGFYPTIGLLSRGEKVRVDLQPLSG